MKKKSKSRGSTLIIVIMVFSALAIFGGGIITMSVGEYKAKISESKRVENLYGAESGLDVIQSLLGKTFECAVHYSNIKVEDFKTSNQVYIDKEGKKEELENELNILENNPNASRGEIDNKKSEIEDIKKDIYDIVNQEFKRNFISFTEPSDGDTRYEGYVEGVDLFSETESAGNIITDTIKKSIGTLSYPKIDNNGAISVSYNKVNFDNGKPDIFYYKNEKLDGSGNVNYDGVEKVIDNGNVKKYLIKITSEFASTAGNVGENRRKVQTSFDFEIPDYKSSEYTEGSEVIVKDYPVISGKILSIDGNLDINTNDTVNKVSLSGDVHVTGNRDNIPNVGSISYTKYHGGVSIGNSNVEFNDGYVATGETFNVENNATVGNSQGNANDLSLYARNIYIGNKMGKSSDSHLSTNKIYTDNDMTLNAVDSSISTNEFYGLNDKNVIDNGADTSTDKSLTSSSIIVNGNENSSVNVKDKALIMGVGYIDVEEGYQTGESTAVKGNYLAYADPSDYPDINMYQYGNLRLMDDTLDVFKKSEIFNKYWNKNGNVNTGGISLPEDTKAIGSFFYRDNSGSIVLSNGNTNGIDNDKDSDIVNGKREYAKMVYNLGKLDKITYDSYGEGKKTVDTEVDFDVDTGDYSIEGQIGNRNKFIYNKDKSKKIVIKKISSGDEIQINNDTIVIDGNNLNAMIVTNGDVQIEGQVNFRGSIIALGNASVIGVGEKNLIYDESIIRVIEMENVDLISKIFKDDNYPVIKIGNVITGSDSSDISQYDAFKYIKSRAWKLIS